MLLRHCRDSPRNILILKIGDGYVIAANFRPTLGPKANFRPTLGPKINEVLHKIQFKRTWPFENPLVEIGKVFLEQVKT